MGFRLQETAHVICNTTPYRSCPRQKDGRNEGTVQVDLARTLMAAAWVRPLPWLTPWGLLACLLGFGRSPGLCCVGSASALVNPVGPSAGGNHKPHTTPSPTRVGNAWNNPPSQPVMRREPHAVVTGRYAWKELPPTGRGRFPRAGQPPVPHNNHTRTKVQG